MSPHYSLDRLTTQFTISLPTWYYQVSNQTLLYIYLYIQRTNIEINDCKDVFCLHPSLLFHDLSLDYNKSNSTGAKGGPGICFSRAHGLTTAFSDIHIAQFVVVCVVFFLPFFSFLSFFVLVLYNLFFIDWWFQIVSSVFLNFLSTNLYI